MASLISNRINGVYADAFRVFNISDNQITLMAAVYDTTYSTINNFTNVNGVVTFSEINSNTSTEWKLQLVDSQIVLCPENHSHNMILITESTSHIPTDADANYVNGWDCDICLKHGNLLEFDERYFCSTCIADVCTNCVGTRKQYVQTLNGTATSTITSNESLTFIPANLVVDYCNAINGHRSDIAQQYRIDSEQRAARQQSAYGGISSNVSGSGGGGGSGSKSNSSTSKPNKNTKAGRREARLLAEMDKNQSGGKSKTSNRKTSDSIRSCNHRNRKSGRKCSGKIPAGSTQCNVCKKKSYAPGYKKKRQVPKRRRMRATGRKKGTVIVIHF